MASQSGSTRDHHVPRIYLKRFARPKGNGFQLSVANVYDANIRFTSDIKNVGVERGFYWGSDQLGIPHHQMEAFLSKVEASASAAFRRVLDTGKLPGMTRSPGGLCRKTLV